MKRVFNALQWVALLAAVGGILWIVFRPSPPLDYAPEAWANWDGFMTISYAGVTRDDSAIYPSSAMLKAHLTLLKQAGYKTITTADALAFLEHRAPLPEKALLILFEGARKETFIRAHPVLRTLGMQAVLCIPTESVESWDESRLKARDVRKITLLPQWDLASMGHEAVNPIVVSESDVTDHFLSTRKWLPSEKRMEKDAEFGRRIEQDYRSSASLLKKLNGAAVSAYVYPFSDAGHRAGADPLAAELNYGVVTSCYRMAFVSASNPYNSPGRNRFELSRLRLNGEVSAPQVLTLLKHAAPLGRTVTGVSENENWIFLNGARVTNNVLRLDDGDAAWVRGSDLWTDAEISMAVKRTPGAVVTCFARFLSPSDCIRLSVDPKTIRLQESWGGIPTTVATVPTPGGEVLRMTWRVKGSRSWLIVNGRPMFDRAPLAESNLSGAIGFENRAGRLSIEDLEVNPLIHKAVMSESWSMLPMEKRMTATEYLPPFPPVGQELSARQCLDYIQAVAEGAAVWPLLTLAQSDMATARVDVVNTMLAVKDLRAFVRGFVVDASCPEWARLLRAKGFKVMYRVGPGEAMPIDATNRVDYVWLEGDGSNVLSTAREFLHWHPPSQLMVQEGGTVGRAIRGVGRIERVENAGRGQP